MIVVFTYRRYDAVVCRACSFALLRQTTLHCALFGWWGYIAPFVNAYCLVANAIEGISAWRMKDSADCLMVDLSEETAYAQALLEGKPFDVVVEVLCERTGAPPAQIIAFLSQIDATA